MSKRFEKMAREADAADIRKEFERCLGMSSGNPGGPGCFMVIMASDGPGSYTMTKNVTKDMAVKATITHLLVLGFPLDLASKIAKTILDTLEDYRSMENNPELKKIFDIVKKLFGPNAQEFECNCPECQKRRQDQAMREGLDKVRQDQQTRYEGLARKLARARRGN